MNPFTQQIVLLKRYFATEEKKKEKKEIRKVARLSAKASRLKSVAETAKEATESSISALLLDGEIMTGPSIADALNRDRSYIFKRLTEMEGHQLVSRHGTGTKTKWSKYSALVAKRKVKGGATVNALVALIIFAIGCIYFGPAVQWSW